MGRRPDRLTVIFDGDCVLCRRSVHWLGRRQTYVAVEPISAGRPQAIAAYGDISGYGQNMVVVADDGRSWVGPPAAYLVVMWAVRGTRALSFVLSLPVLSQLTGRVFQTIAGNRHLLGKVTGEHCERCTV